MKKETGILKTYVHSEKGDFFISTIHRQSSAALNPEGWFYETLAWRMEGNERKNIVADNSGSVSEVGAIRQHSQLVESLYTKGTFESE